MMRLKTLKGLTFLTSIFLAIGCAIKDQGQEAVVGKIPLSCAGRAMLMTENESASFHFNFENQRVDMTANLDIGDTMRHLEWGNLQQSDPQTATYSSPSLVPETRRIAIEGTPTDGRASTGSCYIYLLDDDSYGVPDEGDIRGLIASSYQTTTLTTLDSLSPRERGVIRDLNLTNATALFAGVSTLAAPFAVRLTGTITTQAANYWFRFTSPNTSPGLWIDGVRVGTGNGTGAEIPATNTPTTTTPNYNTGIPLTAGKHRIQMDFIYSGGNYKLEWTTTKPTTTVKPYVVVPPSAFDRD